MVSCSSDIEQDFANTDYTINEIKVSLEDFKNEVESRTNIWADAKKIHYTWAVTDTIGIFPSEGKQVEFPMTEGAGTQNAKFTGGGWGLKQSSTYAAYCPLIGQYYLDKTNIPVHYTGQIQEGNNNTAHLGKFDYLAAPASKVQNGTVSFDFKRLGCVAILEIPLSEPGVLSSITLSCDQPLFIEHGTYDLNSHSPQIISEKLSKTFKIDLKNFTISSDNLTATIYFMTPPLQMIGKQVKATIIHNGVEHTGTVQSKDMAVGTAYKLPVTLATPNIPSTEEWVDLGLPSGIRWATCNVGAKSPEEYGLYFSWGDIAPKSTYTNQNTVTQGKIIGNISGNKEYDAARVYCGGNWRMPMIMELRELIDLCTWKWTTYNGVEGMLVTGPNGNNIFLPATKDRIGSGQTMNRGYGNYWSSDPKMMGSSTDGYHAQVACSLGFLDDGSYWWDEVSKTYGHTIRPVMNDKEKSVNKWIDLGLPSGIKWASFNVGATLPEEYGDYFAWGETKPKANYSKETYLHGHTDANGNYQYDDLTNISGNVNYDAATANWGGSARMPTFAEYKELLDSNNCTSRWSTRNGVYGLLIVSKKNGNSIFFPSAGYRSQTSLRYNIDRGRYWISEQYTQYSISYAHNFEFGSTNVLYDNSLWAHSDNFDTRYHGLPIRPVCE